MGRRLFPYSGDLSGGVSEVVAAFWSRTFGMVGYGIIAKPGRFLEYQNAGVPEFWIVDPRRPQVDCYVLHDEGDNR